MNIYLKHQQERREKLKAKLLDATLFVGTLTVILTGVYIYTCRPFTKTEQAEAPNFDTAYSQVLQDIKKEPTVTLSGKSEDIYIVTEKDKTSSKSKFELTVAEVEQKLAEQKPLKIENPFENVDYQVAPQSESQVTTTLDDGTVHKAPTNVKLSDEDYDILLRITEAEAGGEDAKGKRMVVHTILNRVVSSRFPNTVKEVVFQCNSSGTYQYTPISNGRYFKVTPSQSTIEAVNQAVKNYFEGTDETGGAEFFMSPSAIKYDTSASEKGANWQRDNLLLTVSYGTHEFRKYK